MSVLYTVWSEMEVESGHWKSLLQVFDAVHEVDLHSQNAKQTVNNSKHRPQSLTKNSHLKKTIPDNVTSICWCLIFHTGLLLVWCLACFSASRPNSVCFFWAIPLSYQRRLMAEEGWRRLLLCSLIVYPTANWWSIWASISSLVPKRGECKPALLDPLDWDWKQGAK